MRLVPGAAPRAPSPAPPSPRSGASSPRSGAPLVRRSGAPRRDARTLLNADPGVTWPVIAGASGA